MPTVFDRFLQSFDPPEGETPPPGGMTFEQRAALIGALYELRTRGRRPFDEWIFDVRRVLSYSDATKPLAEALPTATLEKKTSSDEGERKASELVRIGIQIAEMHPVAAFGGDVRHLLTQSVEGALVKSCPVRLLRLVLPTLFVLFSGGLLWGIFQVDGIKNAASTALTDINKGKIEVAVAASDAEASVQKTASTATSEIENLSTSLQAGWRAQLQTQAESQLNELAAMVKQATAAAEPRVNAELDSIAHWGHDQKQAVEKEIEDQSASLSALKPAIETAKAQVQPQIDAQLAEITQWGDSKRTDIEKSTNAQKDALDALKPAIETAKAQVQPQIDAQLAEITQWGDSKRTDFEKSINTQKDALDALKPAIEIAKAQVQPQIDAQLVEITRWGDSKKTDIEKSINAQKDALDALKPAIETAKAQVQPQIDAQIVEITRWGDSKKTDIEKSINAQKDALDALKPAIETAKAQVQPQIAARLDEITRWGDDKKNETEKVIEAQKNNIVSEMNNRLVDIESEQSQIKTQLALILNGARSEDTDIDKTLVDTRNRLLETQNQQRDLDEKLERLKVFVDQATRLEAVIDRADSQSTLTFATLVRTLEVKDGVAIGAAIMAGFAIILSGVTFWRRSRSSA